MKISLDFWEPIFALHVSSSPYRKYVENKKVYIREGRRGKGIRMKG